MSDIKASPPAPSSTSPASPSAVLPGSERPNYRGKCLYKTGKCMNERALKTSGAAHNLCDEHRNRQNQHQRKLDAKNRLHKRERRVSAGAAKAEAAATTVGTDGATSSSSAAQTPVLATASSGVMFLPNGPQPPQVSYPFVMQDFDGIVVPLPSYLEGQERIEFRSRIYQKVLDFISEECILRFGAKVDPPAVNATATDTVEKSTLPAQSGITELETEHPTSSERDAPTPSEANDISDAQQSSPSGSDESSPSTKKVH
ncbi:RAN GTPase-activating protein 1 [Phytophthora nicotianae]|uniref:RAN GTPase-activating protein 1 n=1 Tax=Phytophthora nicotianae TaxID=4792 RepID=A0A0W8CRX5_PHYNI|nr:RAN GTPase-activating protein 1 [Phytophthora nicotianae]